MIVWPQAAADYGKDKCLVLLVGGGSGGFHPYSDGKAARRMLASFARAWFADDDLQDGGSFRQMLAGLGPPLQCAGRSGCSTVPAFTLFLQRNEGGADV